jgi:DNA replication protein DnaC
MMMTTDSPLSDFDMDSLFDDLAEIPKDDESKTPELIAREIGIDERYIGGFETYTANTDETAAAKDMAMKWVEAFDIKRGMGLRIVGGAGVGKTHLGCAILLALRVKGHDCAFYEVPQLFSDMRKSFGKQDEGGLCADQLIEACCNHSVVMLDDLGREANKDWVWERLYLLINSLYKAKKTLIVTSNFTLKNLTTRLADPAIIGRIYEMTEPFRSLPKTSMRGI